jgi:hypothetical protein
MTARAARAMNLRAAGKESARQALLGEQLLNHRSPREKGIPCASRRGACVGACRQQAMRISAAAPAEICGRAPAHAATPQTVIERRDCDGGMRSERQLRQTTPKEGKDAPLDRVPDKLQFRRNGYRIF